MEVEIELTPEDIGAFQRYHYKNYFAIILRLVFSVCILLFALAASIYIQTISSVLQVVTPIVGTPIIAAGLGALLIRAFDWVRALNKNRNLAKSLGWRRLLIEPQAIRSTTEFGSGTFLWTGIEKVAATHNHAFFYITPVNALIVPRRAFPNDRAFDAFVDMAKHYHGMGSVGEGETWKRRGETGIQAPDPSGKSRTLEGIIPKEDDSRRT